MSDNRDLPYYLAGLPVFPNEPVLPRRTYWMAELGTATIAGHSPHGRRRVREFLHCAGFTEIVTTHDPRHIATVVAMLREAHLDGRRAGVVGDDARESK